MTERSGLNEFSGECGNKKVVIKYGLVLICIRGCIHIVCGNM